MSCRIVNLDDRQVLQSNLLAEGDSFNALAINASVMGGLFHLISEDGPWHGKHLAVVSPHTLDEGVPSAMAVANMSASMLYSPASAGRERFTHISKKVREELAEFYGYSFVMRKSTTTTIDENGTDTTKNVSVLARRPIRDPEAMDYYLTMGPQDVVIINLDKQELLDPRQLQNAGSLADLVLDPSDGMTPVVLAVLLDATNAPTVASDELAGLPRGSWAGDRIAVVDRTSTLVLSQEFTNLSSQFAAPSDPYSVQFDVNGVEISQYPHLTTPGARHD